MQNVRCVIPTISLHTEASLKVEPRYIECMWKINNLFDLSDFHDRYCSPSEDISDH